MIRRIQITNDLLDVIKSCPSGVIDDIYKIEYYIQGFDTVYEAEFTHEGDCLKVVLPSSELEKLESGILMRRAYYKVSDSSYPDGYYNLTFEDNMNVWLGGESSGPDRQYITDKELNETLENYALKTEVPSLDGYATEQWVESKGYVTAETLPEGIATESWVQSQGYLTEHQDLSSYALKSEIPSLDGYVTQSWVTSQGYLTEHQDLTGYATQSWVTNQGYITSVPDTFATKDWVSSQGYLTEHQDLSSYALKSEIPSLDGYATESWISSQQFATQSWVTSQGYLTSTGLSGLATQSWVSSNFLSTNALNGYATQEWVTNQGYITSVPDTFATKNGVQSQNYLTEHQSLEGYATQSWATSQFLEESKIWTGTQSAWDALTSTQKASYTIALITE